MVYFEADGNEVTAWLDMDVRVELCKHGFARAYDSEATAAVIARHLTNIFNDRLAEIRERAYNEGWRHAKAKHKKFTDFVVTWDPDIVG